MGGGGMSYPRRGLFSQVFGVIGLVSAIFLVIGSVFSVVGWLSWRSAQEFQANGVDVMGRVEKRWESTHDCKDNNSNVTRTCTDFNVGYAYEVAGKTLHDSATTDYNTYADLAEGTPIKLRYLPGDPGDSVTSFDPDTVDAAGGMTVLALVFGGLGGLFVLFGGGGLLWLIRGALRRNRVRDGGTARGAVVLAREETNVRVNNRVQWRIRWKDDTGAMGQSRAQPPDGLPEVGARITVYADPTGRLPAVWEGDSGSR